MRVSRVLRNWPVIFLLTAGCVERYIPVEDDLTPGTLVVNADLNDKDSTQTISISRSDRLTYPSPNPESNCVVEVTSDRGETIVFRESEPGHYEATIPRGFMYTGGSYRLRIVTSNGNLYESEESTLRPSTGIDRVYYELDSQPTAEPGVSIPGIRFYMDFEINPDSSEFMRWELRETYEFHNPNFENFIYDRDRVVRPIPDSMSDLQCWITKLLPEIYTLTSGAMNGDHYTMMPLHFVSNETQRLKYGYSVLVRQYSMDESAFRYWDELKKNSQEMGGIYDRQPSLTPSNICNCEEPEERILGFFSVSGVEEKRIFVRDVKGLEVPDMIFCLPTTGALRLRYIWSRDLPVFLSRAENPIDGSSMYGLTQQECQDCRLRAGSQGEAPDYWPF